MVSGAIYHWEAVNRACNRQLPLDPEPFVKTALQSIENGTVPGDLLYDVKEYIAKKEIDRAARNLVAGRREEAIKILKTYKPNNRWHKRLILLVMATMPYPLFQKVLKLKRSFNHCVKVAMSQ